MDMMRFNDLYLRLYNESRQGNGEALLNEFYALWCEAEKGGVDRATLITEADNCLLQIADSDLFTLAACEWIGKKAHRSISKALMHQVGVRHLQCLQLLKFDLTDALESSAIAVAPRMCVLTAPVSVVLGWVLSLHEARPFSAKVIRMATRVIDFLVAEYPVTCKRLLEAEHSPFAHSEVAQDALKRLVTEAADLDALPGLIELRMSSDMRRSLRYLRRDENRSMMEQVRENSLFDLITTAQHFKYSNSVAMEYVTDREPNDAIIPMFTEEMSIELPQTWITDPIGYAQIIKNLWRTSDE
ncbi:hypothetical protein [Pseudomonas sp. URMO17WK12:I12]|uniref:hypothetical protein n=1 Tax=Pseudomonas sp. URMO17WK12:I12 TaxID=1259797 RepID=UPI0004809957|nr:hypothetical protein [Pseudomonas sp. URMO17WK12:I12]